MSARPASRIVGEARARWQWVQRLRPWRAFSHFTDVGGGVLSAGMSYQAVFAVFAALWVGFGVFGAWLRGHEELLNSLIEQINHLVPGLLGTGENAPVPVDSLLGERAISWPTAIAAVSLLWVTVTWFTGTRRAIRIIFGLEVKQYRNAVLLKLRDLLLALLFLAALLISAALTVASTNFTALLFEWFGADSDNWLLGGLGLTVRYAAMYVFDVILLLAIHWLLAEIRTPGWSMLRGCALGGVATFGLKVLGAFFLGGTSSNPLLASFAVIIGLLIWFNLICRTLLLTASWIATGQDPELGLVEPGASGSQAPGSADAIAAQTQR